MADDHLEKMNAVGGAGDKVNRMRKQASEEVDKVSNQGQATQKKPRFIWTGDVHNCFLDAVNQIGFNRAVPTKILELMNVKGLTRENVASHLQKHRIQVKRRAQERARAYVASENVSKGVYSHMSAIPQQPLVLPNTMQGIDMDSACLDGSQLAPSLPNHNLNMIQAFPTVQEVYGTPFDEGVNRMCSARPVHGLYDSNGPHDINRSGCNYSPLPPKPLVDSYGHNLMDPHDTTLVPLYDRLDELSLQDIISPFLPQYDRRDEGYSHGIISPSLVSEYDQLDQFFVADQGIISPSFVPQYDRRDEGYSQGIISPSLVSEYDQLDQFFVADQGIISPSFVPQYDRRDEAYLQGMTSPSFVSEYDQLDESFAADQGIISPSFVPQYDRRDELFVADQGIISPLLVQNMEGLGVGMTRLPEAIDGLIRMKVEGFGLGMPHPPTGVLGMKFEGLGLGGQRLPEATGGIAGMKFKGHVPPLPEATGCLTGMKVEGLGADVTHLPEITGGPGFGVPQLPEATGGLTGMNDFQQVLPLNEEEKSALDFIDFCMNMKWGFDDKSLDYSTQR